MATNGQTFIFAAYPFGRLLDPRKPPDIVALVLSVPRSGTLAIWTSLVLPFLRAGLIALDVSVGNAIFLARSVYRPIRRVTEAAEKMAQGQYDQEVLVAGPKGVRGLPLALTKWLDR